MSWLPNASRGLYGRGVALNLTNYLIKKKVIKEQHSPDTLRLMLLLLS